MKFLARLAAIGIIIFIALQTIRPTIPAAPATAELQAPPEIKHILEKDCYACHSNESRLAWFDQIVPGYWLVRHDILTAREHLNFSTIGTKPAAAQRATLFEAVNMIQLGAMPLPQFTALHPDAKVAPEDLATLKAYLAPWGTLPTPPAALSAPTPTSAAPTSLSEVSPEFNGLAFDPTFEDWKVIATTDRGDNNTFRFILGNDIAFKAAQSGNITPWPDGARFAKIAWQQQLGTDGLVHPGKFIQVELMVKDAAKYKSIEGWGWGRWRGLDLKPYGKDAKFVTECTTCHLPVKGDDYVYTLPITTAKVDRQEAVNNHAAALPASLPYQPLGWTPITMYVDPRTHTTATLFGNEAAARSINSRSASPPAATYQPGSVLALVTWVQREDPHWFGARIPDAPQSVEFVTLAAPGQTAYRHFAGTQLTEAQPNTPETTQRIATILGLPPASLP
jgi:hypothetical protein